MLFASSSVPRHLLRGLLGALALAGALAGTALAGPVALVLLPVTFLLWRGCPMCWTIGLMQTLAHRTPARDCTGARCA